MHRRLLLYCAASLLAAATAGVNGQTIEAVRLVDYGYNYGVLEARVSGVGWGRVCSATSGTAPGFDNNAASTVCAMLGFRPVAGLATTLRSLGGGPPNIVVAVQSCTGFREASQSTWNLGNCELLFGSSIPAACNAARTDYPGVSCPGQTTTSTTTPGPTTTPNLATVAPVDCANVTDLRLFPGPNEGLVLIKNPSTDAFGTICAAGFGIAEATTICRMLCKGTVNAIGYSGSYVSEAAKYPMLLSGLRCPANVNSTNFCRHNGWGTAGGVCISSAAVSVRCNELPLVPPPIPTASVECFDYAAHVYFNKTEVSTPALLSLQGGFNATVCNFTTGENATNVWATIPYLGCNSSVSSNDTHIMYTARLYKNVTAVTGGVFVDSAYVYTVTCAVAKPNEVTARMQPDVRTVPPIGGGDTYSSEVRLYEAYSGGSFSTEILPTKQLTVGQKVYARVSVLSPLSVRLIVRSCWATATPGGTARYYIILNKCPSASATLFRIDDKTVGLNFIVMSFSSTTLTQVYIYCDVTICTTTETTGKCAQVCGATVRRRREAPAEEEELPTRRPFDGPFELVTPQVASGAGRLVPAASAVALVAMAAVLRQFWC